MTTRPQPVDWLVMAFLVVAWGSAFAALKIAVAHIEPVWNAALRLWIAVATLAVVLLVRRERLPPARHPAWRFYATTGLVGMAAPFILFAYAAQSLPSAVNAMCNGASPIFTAVLAHLFVTGDRLSLQRAAGVGVGFLGLAALLAPKLAGGVNLESLAMASAIGAAGLYAVANVLTKNAPPAPPATSALMLALWGAIYATAAALVAAPLPAWPPWPAAIAVVAQGVFPAGLATIGWVFLIQRRGPLFVSLSIYLAPLWATAVGMAFLGERPEWTAFLALALILAGVALATLERREVRPGPPERS
jgi:drug/metabolite transporter (DMT)-like permease